MLILLFPDSLWERATLKAHK